MPRFVILRHDPAPDSDRPVHWDFMLEAGGVLRTWALAEEPRPGTRIAAEKLTDHRPAYLDYEGPVSGHRGSVTRWDAGDFQWLQDEPATAAVRLRGRRLIGEARLTRNAPAASAWEWSFAHEQTRQRAAPTPPNASA